MVYNDYIVDVTYRYIHSAHRLIKKLWAGSGDSKDMTMLMLVLHMSLDYMEWYMDNYEDVDEDDYKAFLDYIDSILWSSMGDVFTYTSPFPLVVAYHDDGVFSGKSMVAFKVYYGENKEPLAGAVITNLEWQLWLADYSIRHSTSTIFESDPNNIDTAMSSTGCYTIPSSAGVWFSSNKVLKTIRPTVSFAGYNYDYSDVFFYM